MLRLFCLCLFIFSIVSFEPCSSDLSLFWVSLRYRVSMIGLGTGGRPNLRSALGSSTSSCPVAAYSSQLGGDMSFGLSDRYTNGGSSFSC